MNYLFILFVILFLSSCSTTNYESDSLQENSWDPEIKEDLFIDNYWKKTVLEANNDIYWNEKSILETNWNEESIVEITNKTLDKKESKIQNSKPQNSAPQNSTPQNSKPQNSTPQNSKPQNSAPQNSAPSEKTIINIKPKTNTTTNIIKPKTIQNSVPQNSWY